MSDLGHKLTDKELEKLERRIASVYREAQKDLQGKVDDYFAKFVKRDAHQKALLDAGDITKEQYTQWRLAQIGRGERLKALRDQVAERMTKANEIAVAYANNDMAKIYALNRNFTVGDIIKQSGGMLDGINFIQWDESTVKRLLVEQPDIMPYYPLEKALRRGIDLAYGKRKITEIITSGILQGQSINAMAKSLMDKITDMNKTSAIRAARSAVTNAENAGRQDGADELEKMGVILEKEWAATHDGKTRDEHRDADGQRVPSDMSFEVGGEKLMFPGDSSMGASGWNLYNCRCTRRTKVVGFKSILTDKQKKRAKIRRVK